LQREAHAGGILLPNSQRGERFLITSRIPHTSALRRMACSYRFGYTSDFESVPFDRTWGRRMRSTWSRVSARAWAFLSMIGVLFAALTNKRRSN